MKERLKSEIAYIKKRNYIYKELESILDKKDYLKVEPDYFEDYDWFVRSNERIKPSTMVKLVDPTGNVVLLRPDVTTNIIKQILPYWEDNSEIKMYYNASIFRQSKSGFKQIQQFGYEILGGSYIDNTIEIINTTMELFETLNDSFSLVLGNQYELERVIDALALSKTVNSELKQALMQKNQIWIDDLLQDQNTFETQLLKNILSLNGNIEDINEKAGTLNNPLIERLLDPILNTLSKLNEKYTKNIYIDLSLFSEFDYYSGIVFQGYLKNTPYPILSGGRYDRLTEKLGKKITSVGTSFDVLSYIKEVQNG